MNVYIVGFLPRSTKIKMDDGDLFARVVAADEEEALKLAKIKIRHEIPELKLSEFSAEVSQLRPL